MIATRLGKGLVHGLALAGTVTAGLGWTSIFRPEVCTLWVALVSTAQGFCIRRWLSFPELPMRAMGGGLWHALTAVGTLGLVLLGVPLVGLLAHELGDVPFSWALVTQVALAAYGLSGLVTAWGIGVERRCLRFRRKEIPCVGLPQAFDGYRIVQLSDLHIGRFATARQAAKWCEEANRLRPDLIVVTGDVVERRCPRVRAAVAVLRTLRASDGVLMVLGNHDLPVAAALSSELTSAGIQVLRNRQVAVNRGGSVLVVGGLEYQDCFAWPPNPCLPFWNSDDFVVLLAHAPRAHRAARWGRVPLVLAGHTHGGQVGIPGLARWLNLSTLVGQQAHGVYRGAFGRPGSGEGTSWLHVSAGLGTSGPPIRLGVPPEIVEIVLRASTD